MDTDTKKQVIAANLEALEKILYEANTRTSDGIAAIKQGELNGSIGAIIGVEDMLKQATALYGAAIAIHRA